MPTTNARGHVIPLGTEATVNRATIFTAFGNSIRDVVTVANTTARSALVTALTSAGQGPTSARPLVVYRHDARGLHKLEYTWDGSNWLPCSGVLDFATLAARNTWTTSYAALLSVDDRCTAAGVAYTWTGTKWAPTVPFRMRAERSADGPYASNAIVGLLTVDPGVSVPAGDYRITFVMSLGNTQGCLGEFRIEINGSIVFGPIKADHGVGSRQQFVFDDIYTLAADGPLVVSFRDFRAAGSPTVYARSVGLIQKI